MKVDQVLRVVTGKEILADIEASAVPDWPDETMSTAQAARAMGISQASLREWTRAGLVPFVSCGKYRRYRIVDITALTSPSAEALPPVVASATVAPRGR